MKTKQSGRRFLSAIRRSLLILVCLGILFGVSDREANTQSQASQPFDVEARRTQILKHLNMVIQFYRNSTVPIQTIGEPNDVVYRDQSVVFATQATQLAFDSADAEADLLRQYQSKEGKGKQSSSAEEQKHLEDAVRNIDVRMQDLQSRRSEVEKKIATASPKQRVVLQAKLDSLKSAMDLSAAMKDSVEKIVSVSDQKDKSGLAGEVESLEHSVPQLQSKTPPSLADIASLDAARSSGVSSQGIALLQLLSTHRTLDSLIEDNDELHAQVLELRSPIREMIRNLAGQANQLTQQTTDSLDIDDSKNQRGVQPAAVNTSVDLKNITSSFKAISSASVPLGQELILIEKDKVNLTTWRSSVEREYKLILRSLMLRLFVILIALAIIFVGGEVWTRTTNRYVREPRRRRQFLLLKRVVVGFLTAIVLIFGFVTQFNSLATFAGFITAGIAVGLQTVLLSVAAYFFIIGRYGIKVGDRITILTATGAPITGDVIEVGLVRFYMMELAASGSELVPTGRVSVFSNAVLFQAGFPVYKQIPGTEYAWHELTAELEGDADYPFVTAEVVKVVQTVYDGYKHSIEQQHESVRKWVHVPLKWPEVEPRLSFEEGSLTLRVRFPVPLKSADDTDEILTKAMVQLLETNEAMKKSIRSMPKIRATHNG